VTTERGRIRKHSLEIAGHRTSVSLEDAFWEAFAEMARVRAISVNRLAAEVDRARPGNLSSAIRVFVLDETRRLSGS
jgi:predicted DNA-binding ribbon-helix-helix protein